MRVAVLDIGSNSVHLRVADLATGCPPEQVESLKRPVRLAESTDGAGAIREDAVRRLNGAVADAVAVAESHRADRLVPFATSALRDAANGSDVVAEVRAATGVSVEFMSGEQEARLTFLAARRWFGWSAGPMLLLDIGGGSLEIAYGRCQSPSIAVSLPLGAGRLTRHHLPGETPTPMNSVKALREHVRSVLLKATGELRRQPAPVKAAATSTTLGQLARLTGAPKKKAGPYAVRTLRRRDLKDWIPELAARSDAQRARLRGVSGSRASQILGGAIVARTAMKVLGITCLDVCPWAVREGVFLHHIDALAGSGGLSADGSGRLGNAAIAGRALRQRHISST